MNKRIILILALALSLMGQNIQLHYDLAEDRQYPVTFVEMFSPDDMGSTYWFVTMEYDNGGMSSGKETEWVSVDLLDEPSPSPSTEPPASRRSPGRVGLLVVSVIAALVLLAAWPDGATGPAAEGSSGQASGSAEIPPPDDPRLLAWPGQGPWAADGELLEAA